MINNQKLSIIICTYNRAEILKECLTALVHQEISKAVYEVIIINNNSSDNTQIVAEKYANDYPNFKVVKELSQGLSHARNRGYQEASTDWVAYIDDDAKVHTDFVEQTLFTIKNHDFDAFGGIYLPWYKYGKPKWLPKNFGTNKIDKPKKIKKVKHDLIHGGVMVIKKEVLMKVGGFSVNFGMTGDKIAYGEETALFLQMEKEGFSLGFNPLLKIDHLVAQYKLNLIWHIKAAYAHGRDGGRIYTNKFTKIGLIKSIIVVGIFPLPKLIKKLFVDRNYYWQFFFLDWLKPIVINLGLLISMIKNNVSSNGQNT